DDADPGQPAEAQVLDEDEVPFVTTARHARLRPPGDVRAVGERPDDVGGVCGLRPQGERVAAVLAVRPAEQRIAAVQVVAERNGRPAGSGRDAGDGELATGDLAGRQARDPGESKDARGDLGGIQVRDTRDSQHAGCNLGGIQVWYTCGSEGPRSDLGRIEGRDHRGRERTRGDVVGAVGVAGEGVLGVRVVDGRKLRQLAVHLRLGVVAAIVDVVATGDGVSGAVLITPAGCRDRCDTVSVVTDTHILESQRDTGGVTDR